MALALLFSAVGLCLLCELASSIYPGVIMMKNIMPHGTKGNLNLKRKRGR